MRHHKTRGGVTAPHFKSLTRNKATELAPIPGEIVIPLHMHIGAPAVPLVKKGDTVRAGQLIGESPSLISANVHASVDGVVKSIEKRLVPSGASVESIVITPNAEQTDPEVIKRDPSELSPEEIVDAVRAAGIVGQGGAGFPTHVKLMPPPDAPIDTFIVNGCECEPYLTCDFRSMLEETELLLEGIKLIVRAVGAKKAYIGIESDKPEAAAKIREIGADVVEVVVLPARYPQGAEQNLIRAALGRQVPAGQLPSSVGVLVQNVGTTIAVAKACIEAYPSIERIMTVSGPAIETPRNIKFRIGTSAKDLIDFCGGLKSTVAKVVHGGPMMGTALFNTNVPMLKTSSGLIALDHSQVFGRGEADPCIRCGGCVDRCPQGLRPLYLVSYIEKGMFDKAVDEGLMRCIECGACAYGCPGGRPMVQLLRYGKQMANKQRAAK